MQFIDLCKGINEMQCNVRSCDGFWYMRQNNLMIPPGLMLWYDQKGLLPTQLLCSPTLLSLLARHFSVCYCPESAKNFIMACFFCLHVKKTVESATPAETWEEKPRSGAGFKRETGSHLSLVHEDRNPRRREAGEGENKRKDGSGEPQGPSKKVHYTWKCDETLELISYSLTSIWNLMQGLVHVVGRSNMKSVQHTSAQSPQWMGAYNILQ